ncbi:MULTISPECIES: iron transporter [Halorussus]|uniref:iron transporter n=1 Tax=Halorussus TaxID=1070314 RepID=UPI0020A13AC7|nr:iron transporter [Halorussus vallis]USZ78110.1 iron transporter [Halorussus vallis]
MDRRTFLRAGAATVAAGSLAGCTGLFETTSATSPPPLVENRPDAVYVPTHVEGMEMAGMAGFGESGRYKAGVMYSYPHRFWTITGRDTNLVKIGQDDDAHLMASIWDAKTKTVVPAANVAVDVRKGGKSVDSRNLWPMLSQNMGYHFGDNVSLDGDGTYTAKLEIGAMQARGVSALKGALGERTTVDVEFDYSASKKNQLKFEQLPNRQGKTGAVDPMKMKMMPLSRTPKRSAFPGTVLGEATTGDAKLLAATARTSPHFVADGKTYLVVSPRTPYNRYPLPLMELSATLKRGSQTVFDGRLEPALGPDLGYHYGAAVDDTKSGDKLTVTVDAPPQVARHEGYETAFVKMGEATFTV